MNRVDWLAGSFALVAAMACAHVGGCSNDEADCTAYPNAANCGAGGETSTSSSGASPSCTPSQNSMPVDDMCGVFVSPNGSDSNAGTKEKPLKTLAAATAMGKPVYACAGTTPFTEALAPAKPVDLFGALDCTSWKYTPTSKTMLTAAADAVPLTLASGASGSAVHDFAITAADATMAGGSSIAVLDNEAALTLDKVDIAAGAGKDGTPGAAQAQVMTPASAKGSNGTDDASCNNMSIILGGAGGTNMCGNTSTNGGDGGKGAPVANGDTGLGGQPMMIPSNGGAGQGTSAACVAGLAGAPGGLGTPGTGARGPGDISASGYQSPSATLGGAGQAGQGGGGGGAAHACDASNMFSGPSGGGGGAGGCGGAPGNLGTSGGSSMGILALGAKLTLTNVTVTTKVGGAGGLGGNGQIGANGGLAGHAVSQAACDGGKGGQGGAGGPGGGGAGGHSVGIAIKGGTLPDLTSTTITSGTAGAGGVGSDMTAQTKGDDGKACKTLDFTNPSSPTACVM